MADAGKVETVDLTLVHAADQDATVNARITIAADAGYAPVHTAYTHSVDPETGVPKYLAIITYQKVGAVT